MQKIGYCASLVFVLVSCQTEVIDNTTITEPEGQLSYRTDIQPIFTSSCGGGACHVGMTTSGVRVDSYEAVMGSVGTQYGRPIVDAGKPRESPLIDKVEPNPDFGVRMPRGRSPLSGSEINLISTWIEEGALDN